MRLPKLDTIIIGVFFIFIAFWMVSRCGNKRSDYLQRSARGDDQEERPARRDTVVVPPKPLTSVLPTTAPVTTAPVTQAPVQQAPAPTTINTHPVNTPVQQQAAPAQQGIAQPTTAQAPKYTTLFVTIDGLKMRKEPGLKGAAIVKLDLYEQVYFLNKRSEFTQEISLGKEKVTDHWVKVRTKEGKEGWVFGAGVNYYKEKRKGVLE
jgi:hypothetical protein